MKRLLPLLLIVALWGSPARGATPPSVSIVVDWKDELPNEAIWQSARELGIVLRFNSDFSDPGNLTIGEVPAERADALLARLRAMAGVEIAEENQLLQAWWKPNDPLFQYQWHLEQIHAPEAWEIEKGKGAIVAVIDTGVAYEDFERFHRVEDLAETRFVPGWDFVDDDEHANDEQGHGTHVAGTIAQSTDNGVGVAGIAFACSIMPVRVLGRYGGTAADVAEGIRFAADHGAHVINMSLGSHMPAEVIEKACRYAKARGVTLCCAAGNSAREGVGYPAAYDCCIAVSATRYDEEISWYSSWGEGVTLAAPGGDTRVDQNGDGKPDGVYQNTIAQGDPSQSDYYLYQGTSMATPHVAGVAALLVAQGVKDPDEIQRILCETARDKGAEGWDPKYGHGILDAAAALKSLSKKGTRAQASQDLQAFRVFPLLLSVLPVLGLSLLFLGVPSLRRGLRVLALATAGFCFFLPLVVPIDLSLIPGQGPSETLWLVVNGLAALGLARLLSKMGN